MRHRCALRLSTKAPTCPEKRPSRPREDLTGLRRQTELACRRRGNVRASVIDLAWPLRRALGGGSTGIGPARHDGGDHAQDSK
jgi:hypothetical protein